jgi:hypothetical protein
MAKIKDCVVIEQDLLMEVIKVLGLNQQTELSNKLLFNHMKLEPIVKDAWNQKDTTLFDYLNETVI